MTLLMTFSDLLGTTSGFKNVARISNTCTRYMGGGLRKPITRVGRHTYVSNYFTRILSERLLYDVERDLLAIAELLAINTYGQFTRHTEYSWVLSLLCV